MTVSMHMQKFVKIHQFILTILSGNKIPTSIKGHNSVKNLWILVCNNSNLDLVKINAYAKFDLNPSIRPKDIEQKKKINEGP